MYAQFSLCVRSKATLRAHCSKYIRSMEFCTRPRLVSHNSFCIRNHFLDLSSTAACAFILRWSTGSSSSHTMRPSQSLYDNHVLPVLFHWHIWHQMPGVWIVASERIPSAFASASNMLHTNVVFDFLEYLSTTRSTCAESTTT